MQYMRAKVEILGAIRNTWSYTKTAFDKSYRELLLMNSDKTEFATIRRALKAVDDVWNQHECIARGLLLDQYSFWPISIETKSPLYMITVLPLLTDNIRVLALTDELNTAHRCHMKKLWEFTSLVFLASPKRVNCRGSGHSGSIWSGGGGNLMITYSEEIQIPRRCNLLQPFIEIIYQRKISKLMHLIKGWSFKTGLPRAFHRR